MTAIKKTPVSDHPTVLAQYLESVRPLMEDAEYERTTRLAAEFETVLGTRLQWYLKLKSLWAANYVRGRPQPGAEGGGLIMNPRGSVTLCL